MSALEARRIALVRLGASGSVLEELLEYGASTFERPDLTRLPRLPLPSEPFAADWKRFVESSKSRGALPALREALIELNFPVRAGISEEPAFLAAKRKGQRPEAGFEGVELEAPEELSIEVRQAAAGEIPVILPATRSDFETIVRVITHKNEPVPVPKAMGALLVAGYNDWGRIGLRQSEFFAAHPFATPDEWLSARARLFADKSAYQDRLMVLSAGPYSGVPASVAGFDDTEWSSISRRIRFDHECTHALTKRLLGSMRKHAHDELAADYAGLRAGLGRFSRDHLLLFLGVDERSVRPDGRLITYRLKLSNEALDVLGRLVFAAAETLAELDRLLGERENSPASRAREALAICCVELEELIDRSTAERLVELVHAMARSAESAPEPTPSGSE